MKGGSSYDAILVYAELPILLASVGSALDLALDVVTLAEECMPILENLLVLIR
jgi:hypothetical protein